MQPVHQTSDYLGPLPLELFISIITLSLDSVDPRNALDRLEQLRLVSKTWLGTIDSTPQFWTSIPNDSESLTRIKEWIKKSGDAPLRITSTTLLGPTESFMALYYPLAHRWKSATVSSLQLNASAFFDKPAPLLEELHLLRMSFKPDTSLFAGVTPSLVVVALLYVAVPRDLGFLKHLKSLQLHRVTYPSGKLTIVQLYDILSASPNLRRLDLATDFGDPFHQAPLPFPVLADLAVSTPHDQNDLTSAILSIFVAPNLTKLSVQFNNGPPAPVLPLSISWLKKQSLDQPRGYNIIIEAESIEVFIVPKGDGSCLSEDPQLRLFSQEHSSTDVLIEILEEKLESSAPPHAAVTMEIDSTHRVVGYLKTPRIDQDGTQTWPLSNLRSIRFKFSGYPLSFDWASDFARVRKDIARITVLSPGAFGLASILHVWDASGMSFVPQSRPVIGNGVGSDNEVS